MSNIEGEIIAIAEDGLCSIIGEDDALEEARFNKLTHMENTTTSPTNDYFLKEAVELWNLATNAAHKIYTEDLDSNQIDKETNKFRLRLIEILPTWISVLNELPDAEVSVLTFNKETEDYNQAYYDDEAGTFWNNDGDEIFASHWQELTIPNQ